MAIEVFYGATLARELSSSATEYLWAKWQTLNATQSLSLQRLTEESDVVSRNDLAFLMPGGEDFVFFYVGKNIQAGFGRDLTGKHLRRSKNPVATATSDVFHRAVETATPAFIRFPGRRIRNGLMWQALVLPIRLESTVMLVCHIEQLRPAPSVYEQLFHGSTDAMIVAKPINADANNVVDGRILVMNKAARALLGLDGDYVQLRLSQLPKLQKLRGGFRMQTSSTEDHAWQRIPGEDFNIEVIRFADVVALRLHMNEPLIAKADVGPALAPA